MRTKAVLAMILALLTFAIIAPVNVIAQPVHEEAEEHAHHADSDLSAPAPQRGPGQGRGMGAMMGGPGQGRGMGGMMHGMGPGAGMGGMMGGPGQGRGMGMMHGMGQGSGMDDADAEEKSPQCTGSAGKQSCGVIGTGQACPCPKSSTMLPRSMVPRCGSD